MSMEKVEKLTMEVEKKKNDIDILMKTDIKDLWVTDLDNFLDVLEDVENDELKEFKNLNKLQKNQKKSGKRGKKGKRRKGRKKKQKKIETTVSSSTEYQPVKQKRKIITQIRPKPPPSTSSHQQIQEEVK